MENTIPVKPEIPRSTRKSALLAIPGISATLLALWTVILIASGYGDVFQNIYTMDDCLEAALVFSPAAALYGGVVGYWGYRRLRHVQPYKGFVRIVRIALELAFPFAVWLIGSLVFAFIIVMLQTG